MPGSVREGGLCRARRAGTRRPRRGDREIGVGGFSHRPHEALEAVEYGEQDDHRGDGMATATALRTEIRWITERDADEKR